MNKKEKYRWLGSIGIFYIAGPIWIVSSGRLYDFLFPFIPRISLCLTWIIIGALSLFMGAIFIILSFKALIKESGGHPFDFNGIGKLSRPTQKLHSTGIYYFTQNPMGLGDMMFYASVAIFSRNLNSLIINISIYYLMVWYNNRYNERPSLIGRFGDEYIEYDKNTSIILPGIRTLKKILKSKREKDDEMEKG